MRYAVTHRWRGALEKKIVHFCIHILVPFTISRRCLNNYPVAYLVGFMIRALIILYQWFAKNIHLSNLLHWNVSSNLDYSIIAFELEHSVCKGFDCVFGQIYQHHLHACSTRQHNSQYDDVVVALYMCASSISCVCVCVRAVSEYGCQCSLSGYSLFISTWNWIHRPNMAWVKFIRFFWFLSPIIAIIVLSVSHISRNSSRPMSWNVRNENIFCKLGGKTVEKSTGMDLRWLVVNWTVTYAHGVQYQTNRFNSLFIVDSGMDLIAKLIICGWIKSNCVSSDLFSIWLLEYGFDSNNLTGRS